MILSRQGSVAWASGWIKDHLLYCRVVGIITPQLRISIRFGVWGLRDLKLHDVMVSDCDMISIYFFSKCHNIPHPVPGKDTVSLQEFVGAARRANRPRGGRPRWTGHWFVQSSNGRGPPP